MSMPVGSLTTVPVKSAAASKINWAQVIAAGAMLGSIFGLNVTPAEQVAIVTTIGVGCNVLTFILRTWFSRSVTSSSA